MSFTIEVLKVSVENKGKYRVAVVDHKTSDGKVDSRKVMSFVNKDVFTTLSTAQQGDQFEISSAKDDKGYWQWTSAVSVGKANGASVAKAAGSAVRSSYETPEERAAKQVYIVRQSSISNALEYLTLTSGKKLPTLEDVVDTAKIFEGYVFGTPGFGSKNTDVPEVS